MGDLTIGSGLGNYDLSNYSRGPTTNEAPQQTTPQETSNAMPDRELSGAVVNGAKTPEAQGGPDYGQIAVQILMQSESILPESNPSSEPSKGNLLNVQI